MLNNVIMKALFITLGCIALALTLRIADEFSKRGRIRSVGAKANSRSNNVATFDLSDRKSVEEGLAHYKDLMD